MLDAKKIYAIRLAAFRWFLDDIESQPNDSTLELNSYLDVLRDMAVFFTDVSQNYTEEDLETTLTYTMNKHLEGLEE